MQFWISSKIALFRAASEENSIVQYWISAVSAKTILVFSADQSRISAAQIFSGNEKRWIFSESELLSALELSETSTREYNKY